MVERSKDVPIEWAELTASEREAILEMARGRIFWRDALARFKWLGGLAQVILAVAAGWILFRDIIAEWIQGLAK